MTDSTQWQHKHLKSLAQLTPDQFDAIIDLACRQKSDPSTYAHRPFAGKQMALIFEKDSLRTRFSFEIAARQLGGSAMFVDGKGEKLGTREAIKDQARVLSRYVDCIVLRTFSQNIVDEFAEYASVPVINGLTDFVHPCQALADFMTVREHRGSTAGAKLTYVGDGNNVARSLVYAGVLTGASVTICTPENFQLPESDKTAVKGPGEAHYSNDLEQAVSDAEFVYTDVWASMGQESEQVSREQAFAAYRIDESLMQKAAPGAKFMHCLPAHRGVEVTDAVIDADYSIVFDEAENRLHAQRALITLLLDNWR